MALDARIVLDRQSLGQPVRPNSHLAILPYPAEWIAPAQLPDGTPILLRPIRPEDEPLWRGLLESCSPETLRQRFRCLFQTPTHEMAARFCFIDYDRELAIVAEQNAGGERQIVGVGRLIADPDHSDAEFAVLVADAWQGRGVGSLLMDYCLGICARWGIRSVSAETSPDNMRMLAMFRERGFTLDHYLAPDAVLATRQFN